MALNIMCSTAITFSKTFSLSCSLPHLCTVRLVVVIVYAGNTKGGSITVPLTSCLNGLVSAV